MAKSSVAQSGKFEFAFRPQLATTPMDWQKTCGSTAEAAAQHIASLVGSVCPVPGKYRAGTRKARRLSDEQWIMPTGAVIVVREAA